MIGLSMSLHFGFNCKQFIPSMGKCRLVINDLRGRQELQEHRWVTVREALVYLKVSGKEMVEGTAPNDIKLIKDGKVPIRVRVKGAWSWDDCPLTQTGGQCRLYSGHDGPKVSCVIEIDRLSGKHPNVAFEPSAGAVAEVERDMALRVAPSSD